MQLNAARSKKFQVSIESKSTEDRLMIAADIKPRRLERSRWINLLADLLRSTGTPMERWLRESPTNSQLLGGGQRAGTLRSRVQVIQKIIAWVTTARNISFPVNWKQLMEYFQVRLSESCVRGSLKLLHSSSIFLQEVSGIQDKFTDEALYDVTRKELLASALPGTPTLSWQAPRFPTITLAAREDSVMSLDTSLFSLDTPVFWRFLSWWLLLQCWATLRFDDHRGIVPSELKVSESGLLGKLTRSTVSGPDKKLNFRLLVVHSSAYVHQKLWMSTGVAAAEEGSTQLPRLPAARSVEQLQGLQRQGAQIPGCICCTISNPCFRLIQRSEDLPLEHRALLHGSQQAELHAHGFGRFTARHAGPAAYYTLL